MADRYLMATFPDRQDAEDAFREITQEGLAEADEISVVGSHEYYGEDTETTYERADQEDDLSVGEGAVAGATLGGLTGLLVGVAALAVPGVGPILAAGPLATGLGLTGVAATTLTGAATGAAAGGLVGALTDAGFSEDEARTYADSVREGGLLFAVPVTKQTRAQIEDIFDNYNAQNVHMIEADEREYDLEAAVRDVEDTEGVVLSEEQVQVGKHAQKKGTVHLETEVEEKPVKKTVTLRDEDYEVVEEPASRAEADAFEEDEQTMVLHEEVPTMKKEVRPKMSVRLRKVVDEDTETVTGKVRDETYKVHEDY